MDRYVADLLDVSDIRANQEARKTSLDEPLRRLTASADSEPRHGVLRLNLHDQRVQIIATTCTKSRVEASKYLE